MTEITKKVKEVDFKYDMIEAIESVGVNFRIHGLMEKDRFIGLFGSYIVESILDYADTKSTSVIFKRSIND